MPVIPGLGRLRRLTRLASAPRRLWERGRGLTAGPVTRAGAGLRRAAVPPVTAVRAPAVRIQRAVAGALAGRLPTRLPIRLPARPARPARSARSSGAAVPAAGAAAPETAEETDAAEETAAVPDAAVLAPPAGRTRQQRLSTRSRRLEATAAAAAVTAGLLAGIFAPGAGDGVREARASSSIAEGVSRPGAVDAPAAAPDAGSTADLDASISGQPSVVVAPPLPRSDPLRVRIPQLATDVEVFGADLAPDGGPPSPSEQDAMRAAWYAGGVAPGERGAAILVGHLDTYSGPAAFAGLGSLRPGENIEIDRADGQTAVFTVDSVEQYPKSDFPDQRVYGSVDTPQLRLITCGGRWTQDGGYDSNIVAYARLTASFSSASSQPAAPVPGTNMP
ncbi:class F sortase [Streptomyces litchfieldiae]|uniref:Class F sortase n=1 Tax=Streptomyces litchfieldiae TaxID=3075543 RepID=A0ABU2MV93_9ACTN|nr:class F sortase [Streptomyces sp. DSM 44938]MDT0345014.1 class F sortase [Streptomyces sp. DSM 44938]